MTMMAGSIERSESQSDRGEALAWKVLSRVLPSLRMIAMHENLEITIKIESAGGLPPAPAIRPETFDHVRGENRLNAHVDLTLWAPAIAFDGVAAKNL